MSETGADDALTIGGLTLTSRVLLGTARYPSTQVLLESLEASGTQLVTVALPRVDPVAGGAENLYRLLVERGYHLLPNTAGCFTARDAVLTAELAREALGTSRVKLEVIGDERTLLPDPIGTLEAARGPVGKGKVKATVGGQLAVRGTLTFALT